MNKQSLASFNKIAAEMDRLNYLINREEIYHQNLQSVLQNNLESDSSSSVTDNLDLYLKQYENPTTKSIPFDSQNDLQDQTSQILSVIQRKTAIQEQKQMKRQVMDNKATVILGTIKSGRNQQHNIEQAAKTINCHFSSVNNNNRNTGKKQISIKKSKQTSTKNATSSMPSEVSASVQQHKKNNKSNLKNCSFAKAAMILQSPVANYQKKKGLYHSQDDLGTFKKQLDSKVMKIDKTQLNRLQQKKSHKTTEQSSNRRRTKRISNNPKSTTKLNELKISKNKSKFVLKAYNNLSCKTLDNKKKDVAVKKNIQKLISNDHSWLKTNQKNNTKLNRINIGKLQQNIKKAQNKKQSYKSIIKTNNLKETQQQHSKQKQELKLHFTQQDQLPQMKKIIDKKHLNKQYSRQTDKYLNIATKMSTSYFAILIRQCRQTSEQAIFKIKLVTLMLYFFDQFSKTSLISSVQPVDNTLDQFYVNVAEQQLLQVLLHPKNIMTLILDFPNILMNHNIIASQRKKTFDRKFIAINDLLDQQLQFFLIKKTTLYMYIHTLSEYIQFLVQKQLIQQTKRSKLVSIQPQQQMKGFYSSRGKTGQNIKKYIKKNYRQSKLGFRCDSDRKITVEDDDFYRMISKNKSGSTPFPSTKHKKPIKTKGK